MKRIFVIGCYRSGTTLLQSLLAAHSQVTSFTESHFFDKGFLAFGQNHCWVRSKLKELISGFMAENGIQLEKANGAINKETLAAGKPLQVAKELIRLFDYSANTRGASVWVEKTPKHVFRIPLIEQVAQNVKFVHIIRRPEGVLPSVYKASRQWGRGKPWTECALQWIMALKKSEGFVGCDNHYFLPYERLVDDCRGRMKPLIEWLGLEWEEEILDNYQKKAAALTTRQEIWKTANSGKIVCKNISTVDNLPFVARLLVKSFKGYDRLENAFLNQERRLQNGHS